MSPHQAAAGQPVRAMLSRQGTVPLECRAAISHHWLVRRRGGEKVLDALRELLPAADIYTLVHEPAALHGADEASLPRVHTSLLQYLPGAKRHYPKLVALMPLAARMMKLPAVDLVVCSDAAVAKAMRVHPDTSLVCYCHSPMRYAWEPEISQQYAATLPAVLRPLWPALCGYLRRADRRAADRVDQFLANSRHVAERIRRCYEREATVIYPPVSLPAEPVRGEREDYYLCVGYHVAYKRLDLAIEACEKLGRRLVVVGTGPEAERLRPGCEKRGAAVEFAGYLPDQRIGEHYRKARGLLFPGEEDFGIVPVEAMAHGCPVIAYGVGGAAESVIDGKTGVLFGQQSVASLAAAMERVERMEFSSEEMWQAMQRFGHDRFLREMSAVLEGQLARRRRGAGP